MYLVFLCMFAINICFVAIEIIGITAGGTVYVRWFTSRARVFILLYWVCFLWMCDVCGCSGFITMIQTFNLKKVPAGIICIIGIAAWGLALGLDIFIITRVYMHFRYVCCNKINLFICGCAAFLHSPLLYLLFNALLFF